MIRYKYSRDFQYEYCLCFIYCFEINFSIRFSSLFGVPASLAMLGLTAIYIVAVICVYFSETQPVNNANNVNNVPVDTAEMNNSN